ncbi:outer membrane protein [Labilibacter marinus]|uniref:outer membrane protein n=1 Tax=Labilibacter marinus TaxID=1477105 RepID=UPI00094FC472|nr:outer membrane beta-barrel protein [Labilibacter marinus]
MKHSLIIIGLLIMGLSQLVAQPLTFEQQSIGFAVGIPAINQNNVTSRNPSITAQYEYGISDKIGIGYIGVGGLLSFAGAEYNDQIMNTKYSNKYNYTLIGPRAAYHFDMVDLTGSTAWSNIDVYGGAFLGLKFESFKYDSPVTNKQEKENNTKLATDLFAGIRYGFNDNIGAFAEMGFGVSYFSVGVNWRF